MLSISALAILSHSMHRTKRTHEHMHSSQITLTLQPSLLAYCGAPLGASLSLGRRSSGNDFTGGNVAFSNARRTRRRRATGDKERCVCVAGSAAKVVEVREQRRAHGRAVEPPPRSGGRMVAVTVLGVKGLLLVSEHKRNGRPSDVGELASGFGLVARSPRTPHRHLEDWNEEVDPHADQVFHIRVDRTDKGKAQTLSRQSWGGLLVSGVRAICVAYSFLASSAQMACVSSCQRLSIRSVKASAPPPSRSASGFRVLNARKYSAPSRPDRAIVSKPGPHWSASRRSGSPTSMSLYASSAERMPLHVRSSSPALTGAHARRQPSLSSTVLARETSPQSRAVKTSSAFLILSHSSRVRRAGGGASRAARVNSAMCAVIFARWILDTDRNWTPLALQVSVSASRGAVCDCRNVFCALVLLWIDRNS